MDVNERRSGVRLFWVWKRYLGEEIVWLVGSWNGGEGGRKGEEAYKKSQVGKESSLITMHQHNTLPDHRSGIEHRSLVFREFEGRRVASSGCRDIVAGCNYVEHVLGSRNLEMGWFLLSSIDVLSTTSRRPPISKPICFKYHFCMILQICRTVQIMASLILHLVASL